MRLFGTLQLPAFVDGVTRAVARTFNQYWQHFDLRIHALEELKISWEDATAELTGRGLDRIDDVILPVIDRVQKLAELGFLTATSGTIRTLIEGQQSLFVLDEGVQRELFTATPWVALMREESPEDWAIARFIRYDKEIGELAVEIVAISGSPGPHSDWVISAVAGSTLAVMAYLAAADEARDLAVASAGTATSNSVLTAEDAANTLADRLESAQILLQVAALASAAAGSAAAAATFNPANFYTKTEMTPLLADKAALASPALTGNPTAPTPAAGDSDQSIATTAFVQGEGVRLAFALRNHFGG